VETKDVVVQLSIDNRVIGNKTISEISEDGSANVIFSWDASGSIGEPIDIKIDVDPDNKIDEVDNINNWLGKTVTPGPKPKPPEFNWRPIIFLIAIITVIVVLAIIWRLRRKV
jgi:hypothetical protein